jgi:transposase
LKGQLAAPQHSRRLPDHTRERPASPTVFCGWTRYNRLHVCFEAGPTGYELYRHIQDLGHDCIVVTPG